MAALLLPFAIMGCSQSREKEFITHIEPSHGISIVEIAVDNGAPPVNLLWLYGDMSEPERYTTLQPGAFARIMLSIKSDTTYEIAIQERHIENRALHTVPGESKLSTRTVTVTKSTPTIRDIMTQRAEVIRWNIVGEDGAIGIAGEKPLVAISLAGGTKDRP